MKKLRIAMSVLAVLIAFGGALASVASPDDPITIGYQFISQGDPECVQHPVECQLDNNGIACTVSGVGDQLRDGNATTCTTELWKYFGK